VLQMVEKCTTLHETPVIAWLEGYIYIYIYVIQNYSEFKLNLNPTVPPDGRTMWQLGSYSGFAFAL
jgi:hypothetical protein